MKKRKAMKSSQKEVSIEVSKCYDVIFKEMHHLNIFNWRQWSIEAYDILNQSASYRAQSYNQNKLLFDSIAS